MMSRDLSQMNASAKAYQTKMELVNTTMRKMDLPRELCGRVEQYYNYLWHVRLQG